jgi:SAM-dependent methyltransferase
VRLVSSARRWLAAYSVNSERVNRWRFTRYKLFVELTELKADEVIADIGAGLGRALARYNETNPIIAVDRTRHDYGESFLIKPNVKFILADGTNLPFRTRGIPVVFSNSVIEHVPQNRQADFASEIRRVCDRYFVQTPNRYFPLEPHYQLPFVQFLPQSAMWMLSRRFAMGRRPKGYWEPITLLSARQLKRLFPDATIHRERFFGLTKSLLAVRGPASHHGASPYSLKAPLPWLLL